MPRRAITTDRVERGLGAGRSPGNCAVTTPTMTTTNTTAMQAMVLMLTTTSLLLLDGAFDRLAKSRSKVPSGNLILRLLGRRQSHPRTLGTSTNGVPIIVERAMYWNANGVVWSEATLTGLSLIHI